MQPSAMETTYLNSWVMQVCWWALAIAVQAIAIDGQPPLMPLPVSVDLSTVIVYSTPGSSASDGSGSGDLASLELEKSSTPSTRLTPPTSVVATPTPLPSVAVSSALPPSLSPSTDATSVAVSSALPPSPSPTTDTASPPSPSPSTDTASVAVSSALPPSPSPSKDTASVAVSSALPPSPSPTTDTTSSSQPSISPTASPQCSGYHIILASDVSVGVSERGQGLQTLTTAIVRLWDSVLDQDVVSITRPSPNELIGFFKRVEFDACSDNVTRLALVREQARRLQMKVRHREDVFLTINSTRAQVQDILIEGEESATQQPPSIQITQQPSSVIATQQLSSMTATLEPSSTTATLEPSSTTAIQQPSSMVATLQLSSMTATLEPSSTTAIQQPSSMVATELPSSVPPTQTVTPSPVPDLTFTLRFATPVQVNGTRADVAKDLAIAIADLLGVDGKQICCIVFELDGERFRRADTVTFDAVAFSAQAASPEDKANVISAVEDVKRKVESGEAVSLMVGGGTIRVDSVSVPTAKPPTGDNGGDDGLSSGAVTGIIIAIMATALGCLVLIIAIGYFIKGRRHSKTYEFEVDNWESPSGDIDSKVMSGAKTVKSEEVDYSMSTFKGEGELDRPPSEVVEGKSRDTEL